jgi:hypothetical protein
MFNFELLESIAVMLTAYIHDNRPACLNFYLSPEHSKVRGPNP